MESCKYPPQWLNEGWSHIWLPYTQMQTTPIPPAVVSSKGSKLYLADGTTLVDGIASWWTAAHGYNHPHIISEMEKQLQKMPHIMFGGLAHEPAYTLATRLSQLASSILDKDKYEQRLSRVFFSDSGSVATEIAMKIALQYQLNMGNPRKNKFICMKYGYHGDTLGAMSVSDPQNSMHKAFSAITPKHYVIDIPSGEYDFAEFDEILKDISGNVAALIIEPLVQGAGGMKFYPADTLAEIYRMCKKHNILFIADEIATGFYRTGRMFACHEAGIVPDIMCLGKGLTGGTISLAATLTTESIFEAFLEGESCASGRLTSENKALMHGPTYMANPLACAAANASLDLFEKGLNSNSYSKATQDIEALLFEELNILEGCEIVTDVRVRGAIGVVEIKAEYFNADELRLQFIDKGCWIRPFGNIIYLTPALTISEEELKTLTTAIKDIVFLRDSSH